MQEAAKTALDYVCIQECAVAGGAGTDIRTGPWRWRLNQERTWDTAIGSKCDENTIRDEAQTAQSTHWQAITFQNDAEYITVGNVHMPTNWAEEAAWLDDMAKIKRHNEETRARFGHHTQIWMGD